MKLSEAIVVAIVLALAVNTMAEGVVILPAGFEGFTVDADYLVVKEAEA